MNKSDITNLLSAHPLFKTLGMRGLRRLAASSLVRALAPGEVLWPPGEAPRHLCLISEGMLQMVKVSPRGDAASLRLLLRGEAFGCACVLLDHAVFPDITAVSKSVVVQIPGDLAFEIGRDNPAWFKAVAVHLAMQLVRQMRFRDISTLDAKERIPALLVCLREFTDKNQLHLTQADIAKLSALSEETVNRTMSRLKKQGIVSISRGAVSIIDPTRLANLAAAG